MARNCCCNWGNAVSGEWPEFGCADCPIHQGGLGEAERCKRHTSDRALDTLRASINADDGRRSDRGYCYGVEDGLDGYCVHDPRCRYVGMGWTGPNSGCYRLAVNRDGDYVQHPDGTLWRLT